MSDRYPPGTVRALLETDLLTEATRAVLGGRLEPGAGSGPRFLGEAALATLRAASARLIPQPGRADPVDLALEVDRRLSCGEGDGWRYAVMPPDGEAYRRGLRGLDESARALGGRDFVALDPTGQDRVLAAVQRGEAAGETWRAMPSGRFFEELLAELVEAYYSHPLAEEEIGYAGMADAHGWQRVGPDELEPWEPRRLGEAEGG